MIEGMKKLTQQRIIELLEEVARIEMVLQTIKDIRLDEASKEEFAQYCALQTTIAIAKAKLTSLQK